MIAIAHTAPTPAELAATKRRRRAAATLEAYARRIKSRRRALAITGSAPRKIPRADVAAAEKVFDAVIAFIESRAAALARGRVTP